MKNEYDYLLRYFLAQKSISKQHTMKIRGKSCAVFSICGEKKLPKFDKISYDLGMSPLQEV